MPETSMEGRWGRRVFGRVHRTDHYTRFRLEFLLRNEVVIHETQVVANDELDRYPKLYGWTMDNVFQKLKYRVEQRLQ